MLGAKEMERQNMLRMSDTLYKAAQRGDVEACGLHLDRGADIYGSGVTVTPLYEAVLMGHIDVARLLVARGADINRLPRRGTQSLLFLADQNGDVDMCRLLIEAGVDLQAGDESGWTALHQICARYPILQGGEG
jgi:ankyrin repeat protein